MQIIIFIILAIVFAVVASFINIKISAISILVLSLISFICFFIMNLIGESLVLSENSDLSSYYLIYYITLGCAFISLGLSCGLLIHNMIKHGSILLSCFTGGYLVLLLIYIILASSTLSSLEYLINLKVLVLSVSNIILDSRLFSLLNLDILSTTKLDESEYYNSLVYFNLDQYVDKDSLTNFLDYDKDFVTQVKVVFSGAFVKIKDYYLINKIINIVVLFAGMTISFICTLSFKKNSKRG